MINNSSLETPTCNYCGKSHTSIYLKNVRTWEYKEKFNIVECSSCKLKYLSPRPKIGIIGKFYSDKGYWGRKLDTIETRDINHKLERKTLYRNVYKKILRIKSKGSIYDVGAGIGLFLTYFKELNWKIDGDELSKSAVKYASSNFDISLRNGDFCSLNIPKNKYSVITFNSSLEHLHDPKKALLKANTMLKGGGLVVITVPNIESFGFYIFKKDWLPLHPPKHLYHFSPKTLKRLLNNCGFKVSSVNNFYFTHAYYGIFNSLRYKYSSNFIDKNSKSIKVKGYSSKDNEKNIMKLFEKIIASVFSFIIVIVGGLVGKGETITIYAKKY
jgi:SAM-dependent methyltransferase